MFQIPFDCMFLLLLFVLFSIHNNKMCVLKDTIKSWRLSIRNRWGFQYILSLVTGDSLAFSHRSSKGIGWRDEKPAAVKLQCLTRRGEMLCVEYILDYFFHPICTSTYTHPVICMYCTIYKKWAWGRRKGEKVYASSGTGNLLRLAFYPFQRKKFSNVPFLQVDFFFGLFCCM